MQTTVTAVYTIIVTTNADPSFRWNQQQQQQQRYHYHQHQDFAPFLFAADREEQDNNPPATMGMAISHLQPTATPNQDNSDVIYTEAGEAQRTYIYSSVDPPSASY